MEKTYPQALDLTMQLQAGKVYLLFETRHTSTSITERQNKTCGMITRSLIIVTIISQVRAPNVRRIHKFSTDVSKKAALSTDRNK